MQNYKLINRISAGLAFLLSLIVYMRTIAPTVSFWDCGEFITCAYTLGIPHPPGAPFFLLLGRIFAMIPFVADIGLRVNFISALTSALTVMLTYLIIVRLIKQWRGEPKNWEDILILVTSGLVGSLGLAFSDSFWFNAVEAEVYAISMFFTAVIVWLILVWLEKADEQGSERYLLLIAYAVGIAIGIHLLMILALPAIFMIVYFKYLERNNEPITLKNFFLFGAATGIIFFVIYPGIVKYIPMLAGSLGFWSILVILFAVAAGIYYSVQNKQKIVSIALMASLLVLIGYSTYAMIYIRSGLNPVIDENDPETMENMVKYLNREQYGDWSLFPRRYQGLPNPWEFKANYPNRNYATYNLGKQMDFMWNYQIKKMYGRYFGWQFIGQGTTLGNDNFISENFSLNGLFGLPFLLGLIGMIHHYYKHWRHALSITTLFILTGLAIVFYLNQENPQPRERDYSYVGSFFAFAIWIGMGMTAILEWVQDAFHKNGGVKKALYAAFILSCMLMVPINLLANNYHTHDRTGNYVAYDYSYNILQSCEPNAILFTNGDNDTFPLWFLQYVYNVRRDVRVVNLSLLNTKWYIKQLKHQEPKVPISLKDEEIEQLSIMEWKKQSLRIPVPKDVYIESLSDLNEKRKNALIEKIPDEINVQVAPTLGSRAIRIQDFMVLNIIYANKWKRPITFAVTVSNQNQINLDSYLRMDGLAFKLVPYSGKFLSEQKLETNLFEKFQYRGLDDPDVYYLPNVLGLLQNYRAAFINLAREYLLQQENEKMVTVLDNMSTSIPETVIPMPHVRLLLQVGQWYGLAGETDRYMDLAQLALKTDPNDPMVYGTLVSLLSKQGKHKEATELLEQWLAINPSDTEAKKRLETEQNLMLKPGKSQDQMSDSTN